MQQRKGKYMRIITGEARGKRLITLEGEATRPTGERVKEAVFSMIQFDIEGRTVLDLFGGSGQLGLEALSRGAKLAVINDFSQDAVDIIKSNAKTTGLADRCRINLTEYERYLKRIAKKESFDIIFLDPPYRSDYLKKSLELISEGNIANKNSFIICENANGNVFSGDERLAAKYRIVREANYGKAFITIITPAEAENEAMSDSVPQTSDSE